eukprot:Rmarinus@m.21594
MSPQKKSTKNAAYWDKLQELRDKARGIALQAEAAKAQDVAKDAGISKRTVYRYKAKGIPKTRVGRPTRLSKEMEAEVVEWVVQQDAHGWAPTDKEIAARCRIVLANHTGETVKKTAFQGHGFLRRFKKRHGQLARRTEQSITPARLLGASESKLRPWMEEWVCDVKELGLKPRNVYNADETGLLLK